MSKKGVALIICSTRKPRVCPAIASWITSLVKPKIDAGATLDIVDLINHPLPISPAGTIIPGKIKLPLEENPYQDASVNTWSRAIRQYDAFIFLTPQYNWSLPGSLKVALDHLFHEWAGKPMIVLSYGGRGGGKGAAHLREIWQGLRGGKCVSGVELTIAGEGMGRAQQEGVLDESVVNAWKEGRKDEEVTEGWERLVEVLKETV